MELNTPRLMEADEMPETFQPRRGEENMQVVFVEVSSYTDLATIRVRHNLNVRSMKTRSLCLRNKGGSRYFLQYFLARWEKSLWTQGRCCLSTWGLQERV
eukprot:8129957-Pyramimonas_sp.AAC.1